jgi:hypothetical protein
MKYSAAFKVMLLLLTASVGLPAPAQPTRAEVYKVFGVCEIVPMTDGSGSEFSYPMNPQGVMSAFLPKDFQARLDSDSLSQSEEMWWVDWMAGLSIEVAKKPAHGEISTSQPAYTPEIGFTGKDRAELIVKGLDKSGREISAKFIYDFVVIPLSDWKKASTARYDAATKKYCGGSVRSWEIKPGFGRLVFSMKASVGRNCEAFPPHEISNSSLPF